MLTNNKGFTLMEILVVVTIIGILAAIAVPSYIYAVDKGRQEACAVNIQTISVQVQRYRLEKGKEIAATQDIVAFLQAQGYLVGLAVKCPYAIIEGEESTITYTLAADGIVQCSHCSANDD